MSLLTLPPFRFRRKETAMPETTTPTKTEPDVRMRFQTQGGAVVELYDHTWSERYYRGGEVVDCAEVRGFEWTCRGCGMDGATQHLRMAGAGYGEFKPSESRRDANAHAKGCQSMKKPEA